MNISIIACAENNYLTLLNYGMIPTFIRGEASSMINLTFVSSGLAKSINCWEVSEIYTQSDHRAITWQAPRQQGNQNRITQSQKNNFTGWKASALDIDAMRVSIEGSCAEGLTAEEKVENVMRKMANACDGAMPRNGKGNTHTSFYWWNDKIAQIRAECHKTRRLSQRAKGKPTFLELEEKFKLTRSKLTKAIKRSKRQCWTELLEIVNEDP